VRVQLKPLVAVVVILAAAGAARAQTAFTSKLQVYVDNDHTTVVSPLVQATADVTATTNLTAGYVADVVTSASVDIVTQASKTTIHDLRQQGSFAVAQTMNEWTLHGAYLYSTENDYRSHNFDLGLERRLGGNDTTVALGYALSLDDVMRSGDHNFSRPLDVHSVSLALTQVLSPTVVGQLTYELGVSEGYQASPYRFVPVRPDPGSDPIMWVAETDPDSRVRHALVAALNVHVLDDSAIGADYRFYADSWGISSHTLDAKFTTNVSSAVELRLRARYYKQTGASFYKDNYTEVERYMAIDRELSPLWSAMGGAKLSVRFATDAELELKADVFYYKYTDFPLLPDRTGANLGVGVQLTY
jgi:hypothetical protein